MMKGCLWKEKWGAGNQFLDAKGGFEIDVYFGHDHCPEGGHKLVEGTFDVVTSAARKPAVRRR